MRYWPLLLFAFLIASCSQTQTSPVSPTEAPAPYPAAATVFKVSPSQSNANYIITETFLENASELLRSNPRYGEITTIGATRAIKGEIAIDFTQVEPTLVGGQITVDLTMLRTSKAERDEILKVNWLESVRYPTATFDLHEATNVTRTGEQLNFDLVGDLTIHGVTQPVSFATTATVSDTIVSGEASTTLLMTDFDVDPPKVPKIVEVADAFEIKIKLVANATE